MDDSISHALHRIQTGCRWRCGCPFCLPSVRAVELQPQRVALPCWLPQNKYRVRIHSESRSGFSHFLVPFSPGITRASLTAFTINFRLQNLAAGSCCMGLRHHAKSSWALWHKLESEQWATSNDSLRQMEANFRVGVQVSEPHSRIVHLFCTLEWIDKTSFNIASEKSCSYTDWAVSFMEVQWVIVGVATVRKLRTTTTGRLTTTTTTTRRGRSIWICKTAKSMD